jgi:hypothetical protein
VSFTLDPTTLMPGTSANPVPYDVNIGVADSAGNDLGSTPRTCAPNDDCDIQIYVAAALETPPSSQPTSSPTPIPSSPPSGGFEALIGGGTLDSSYVIDAGFFTAAYGFPPAAETYLYYQTNPYQQFIFAPSGTNYTICNVESGACLTDGGNVVDIGQGTDTWAVTQSGSGWTLQDTRTGQYMGAIPLTSESNIPMSSTPVTVSLSIIQ